MDQLHESYSGCKLRLNSILCCFCDAVLQEDLRKLEVFHMRSQRMILGIRWHDFVRNTEVVDRTNLPCVQDIIAGR